MNAITNRYIQIINKLIDNNIVRDGKDFALTIGVSVSSITEISKGRSNVGLSAIQKTVLTFPNINLNWLITGEGNIFKTKTPENVHNNNGDIFGDKLGDKRKPQKTSTNKQYKITGNTPPVAAEPSTPYLDSQLQQGKGRIIDSSYLEIEIPPERRGIRNMFSGFTDEEIEKAMLEQFVNNVLDMFKTGEAIAPNTMKDIIKQKDDEINELRAKLWQYESAYGPVPPGDNKPFAPHVDNNDKRNPDK